MDLKSILNECIPIIENAALMIKEHRDVLVDLKGKGNYVTSIDIEVEKYLKKKLKRLIPDAGFIAEESTNEIKQTNWVIDPVDGTGNYIYGYPYTISLALLDRNETILGIVYSCKEDELYYAIKGKGAYQNDKPLSVKEYDHDNGIGIFGVPYNRSHTHKILMLVEQLYSCCSDIKRIGPSSLDICHVASGKAKLYVELDLCQWDYLAGELILSEAGGRMLKHDNIYLFYGGLHIPEDIQTILLSDI